MGTLRSEVLVDQSALPPLTLGGEGEERDFASGTGTEVELEYSTIESHSDSSESKAPLSPRHQHANKLLHVLQSPPHLVSPHGSALSVSSSSMAPPPRRRRRRADREEAAAGISVLVPVCQTADGDKAKKDAPSPVDLLLGNTQAQQKLLETIAQTTDARGEESASSMQLRGRHRDPAASGAAGATSLNLLQAERDAALYIDSHFDVVPSAPPDLSVTAVDGAGRPQPFQRTVWLHNTTDGEAVTEKKSVDTGSEVLGPRVLRSGIPPLRSHRYYEKDGVAVTEAQEEEMLPRDPSRQTQAGRPGGTAEANQAPSCAVLRDETTGVPLLHSLSVTPAAGGSGLSMNRQKEERLKELQDNYFQKEHGVNYRTQRKVASGGAYDPRRIRQGDPYGVWLADEREVAAETDPNAHRGSGGGEECGYSSVSVFHPLAYRPFYFQVVLFLRKLSFYFALLALGCSILICVSAFCVPNAPVEQFIAFPTQREVTFHATTLSNVEPNVPLEGQSIGKDLNSFSAGIFFRLSNHSQAYGVFHAVSVCQPSLFLLLLLLAVTTHFAPLTVVLVGLFWKAEGKRYQKKLRSGVRNGLPTTFFSAEFGAGGTSASATAMATLAWKTEFFDAQQKAVEAASKRRRKEAAAGRVEKETSSAGSKETTSQRSPSPPNTVSPTRQFDAFEFPGKKKDNASISPKEESRDDNAGLFFSAEGVERLPHLAAEEVQVDPRDAELELLKESESRLAKNFNFLAFQKKVEARRRRHRLQLKQHLAFREQFAALAPLDQALLDADTATEPSLGGDRFGRGRASEKRYSRTNPLSREMAINANLDAALKWTNRRRVSMANLSPMIGEMSSTMLRSERDLKPSQRGVLDASASALVGSPDFIGSPYAKLGTSVDYSSGRAGRSRGLVGGGVEEDSIHGGGNEGDEEPGYSRHSFSAYGGGGHSRYGDRSWTTGSVGDGMGNLFAHRRRSVESNRASWPGASSLHKGSAGIGRGGEADGWLNQQGNWTGYMFPKELNLSIGFSNAYDGSRSCSSVLSLVCGGQLIHTHPVLFAILYTLFQVRLWCLWIAFVLTVYEIMVFSNRPWFFSLLGGGQGSWLKWAAEGTVEDDSTFTSFSVSPLDGSDDFGFNGFFVHVSMIYAMRFFTLFVACGIDTVS